MKSTRHVSRWQLLLPCVLAVCASSVAGKPTPVSPQPLFERDVLPIFQKHCLKCHGDNSRKAELDLSSLGGVLRGGESGEPAVSGGQPDQSQLIELVKSGKMPPGDDVRLDKNEIDIIRKWIEAGAHGQSGVDDGRLSPALLRARQVHFLLELKCMPCHGRKERQGELDLRTMASTLAGGKSGPALVRGNAEESLIVRRIKEDQMPPRDIRYKRSIKPITEAELEFIRQWIDEGAIEPPAPPGVVEDDGLLVSRDDRKWWAFQKPRAVPVPAVAQPDLVRTPIDAFLLRKLELQRLSFSPEADRRTLIRRLSVDLIGLVPSLEEVESFVNDASPDAFERLVERLLNSPHYGERWGQYWLDTAGYADSEGSASADLIYPRTWKYRDYVVRSLNDDKPFDRFVVEQLAGDELADYRNEQRVTPEQQDNIIDT